MDDDLSDLRNRQTRTERRVADLEGEVKLQADLRAKMDKELGGIPATLKAHEKSLNALGKTQSEHTERLRRIEGKIDNTELWMGHLNGRMDLLENKVTGLGGRMDGVETRLDSVDTRLDGVEGRLGGVETRLGGVDTRLGGVETELAGVKAGVDQILERLGKG